MAKKTKIVATIGPASDNRETLKKMVEAGLNVVRINFSHGTHESNGKVIDLVREISLEMKRPIGIMADLQGPRIRVGNAEEFKIEPGEIIVVSDEARNNGKELIIDSLGVARSLKVCDRILVEDGLIELDVCEKIGNYAKAKAMTKGIIKPRKGINVPDTQLHFGAVTKKDEKDLQFVLEKEVDFVALSFVSNAQEIEAVRETMQKILNRDHSLPLIISKIERKEAMKNIQEIIKATDVIMVARGDLGIELEESKVIIYQKELIAKCLRAAKPVIVATQMLDSMINNPIPTRAEVSDVSNAVIDHTDAVMLSGESANGKYPTEAVARMEDIIKNVEESPLDDYYQDILDKDLRDDYTAIVRGAHELAKTSKAKAVIMYTESGNTARFMSHYRNESILMIAATNNQKTYQQLSIVWGIRAYLFDDGETRENFANILIKKTKLDNKLEKGDKVVVILGKTSTGKSMTLIGIQEVE